MGLPFASAALLSLVLAGVLAAPTVTAPADLPGVANLLAQMRRASGGERWEMVRTLHVVAEVESGGGTEARDRWEDVAAGRYLVTDVTSVGPRAEGFDGIAAWRLARSGIAYSLGDVDSRLVAADESFRVSRGWWFHDRHPATIALVGERSENGRNFDVLSVTPEGGRAFDAWIDRSTHLLARTDEQQAEDRVVTTYADYRAVDGLMIPFQIRSGDGNDPQSDAVETVHSVEINPATTDALYALPSLPVSDIILPKGRDSVEVPFRLSANNRILVKLSANGHPPVEAEFDSGGSLVLQPKTTTTLGMVTSGHLKTGGGGEGSTTAGVGVLDSVSIGPAGVRHLAFHSFAFEPDYPDAALVGLEILQRFVVRFDFDRMRMTLTRPEAFHEAGRGVVVPFHFQDNQPEVKGAIDGIAGLFAIDTGDSGSLLLIAPFARRYGLVDRYHADIPYNGRSVGATHGVWARTRAHTVTLDGADGRPVVEVHDPVTRISLQTAGFDANRNVSANIGLGVLRQFNLTFDYPRQRLILEKNHFYGQPDIFNRTGLRLKRDGAGWTISIVLPDTPADAAGLKPGDRIESIDGLRADQLDEDALAARLKGPVGSRMRLVVSAAERRTLMLVLRDIL
jgi:PDZ domain/Aspartyl protease